MGSAGTPQVITWDYQFAPNAQKGRNLLWATQTPYKICEQPFVKPRPILTDLGITYRRIPVNSIGKDVYCDNRVFMEAVQRIAGDRALPTTTADHAYESFGYRTFWNCLSLVPAKLLSKEMQDDRSSLFTIFSRPDFAELRQSGLAEFRSMLDMVENDFLAHGGQWIGGEKLGIADIHASWVIKFVMQTLDVENEPGFGKDSFPKVHRWINGLPRHEPSAQPELLSVEEAHKQILNDSYTAPDIGIDESDPTGLKKGDKVNVETSDDVRPGDNPQHGKLAGLGRREVVIELENGLRLHFPRIGIVVKKL